jgi:hypothetical protein
LPTIPLHFDINSALTEQPWRNLPYGMKAGTIFFSVIGVTFFVPLEIALSVWAFFVVYQVATAFLNTSGIVFDDQARTYEGLGMFLAYGLLLLWIARHHLWHVCRSLRQPREPNEYLSYGWIVGLLGGCVLSAAGFLATAMGGIASPVNWALGIAAVLLLLFYGLVLTRLVIEAGILLVQLPGGGNPIRALGLPFSGHEGLLTAKQWVISTFALQGVITDQREILAPFVANAQRIGMLVEPRRRPRALLLMGLALLLCYVVSGGMHHVLSYAYGRELFDDGYGPVGLPQGILNMARDQIRPGDVPPTVNRPMHALGGALTVAAFGIARLCWVRFPLHPLGLLLFNSWAVNMIWFSVFLSWAAKWIILRWGGARIYPEARRFFIGLLVGESLAGTFWIVVGLCQHWPSYQAAYQVMPH